MSERAPANGASAPPIGAVVLDIEGTTTPVSFVFEVLFPYARSHVRAFLREHGPELRDAIAVLRDEWRSDVAAGEPVVDLMPRGASSSEDPTVWSMYLMWLMYRDRKSTGLKLIQGRIWEVGYLDGSLHGEVYPDVPSALARWRSAGLTIAIYSSGSVLAQQLLFGHSNAGDLTPFIDCYFDTGVGPKRSVESYCTIASKMHRPAAELLFVSDIVQELDAAKSAGFQTFLCERQPVKRDEDFVVQHPTVRTFEEIPV